MIKVVLVRTSREVKLSGVQRDVDLFGLKVPIVWAVKPCRGVECLEEARSAGGRANRALLLVLRCTVWD